jgi:Pyruvate/2-oxoacid:ferredoxin oxidoreductase delta subunit
MMARNKSWNMLSHIYDEHNKYSCVDCYIYTTDISNMKLDAHILKIVQSSLKTPVQ